MAKFFAWILFIATFIFLAKTLFLGFYPDFNTQYYVPQLVFKGINPYAGGSMLYTPQVYPPTMFLLYLPFSLVPLLASSYIYTFVSLCSLIVGLYFLSKYFGVRFFSITNMVLMSFVFIFFPVKFTLGMGQVNLIILALLVICLYLLKQKKYLTSGVLLGIPLVVKLFPVFLPLLFLKPFNKRVFYGLFVTLSISTFLVLFFIPHKIISEFLNILPSFVNSWKLDYYNQALSGIIGRSMGVDLFSSTVKTVVSLIIVCITFFSIYKNRSMDLYATALKFGVVICVNVLVNTFSWQHHFVWMVVPLYATYFFILKKGYAKKYFLLLLISYFLMAGNFSKPEVLPIIIQSHVFMGGLILLLLDCYLLMKKGAK